MQRTITVRKVLLRLVFLSWVVCVVSIWQTRLPNPVFAQAGCPTTPVVMIDSPQTPQDVCIPDGFGGNPIQYFDDYSWRTFISMMWPALPGQRGIPDPAGHLGDVSKPLVFDTFKNDWDLFLPTGAVPSAWDKPSSMNPCHVTVASDVMVLASYSKFGSFGQAGSNKKTPFLHAVPSQNGKWVRYLTGFNQTEYTQIVGGSFYLLSALTKAGSVTFNDGSIDVKSAWMDMSGLPDDQKARYYTRTALVVDPGDPTKPCTAITVGLIGLHIVQKTPSRPQWIWSTFEQVDNVPSTANSAGPFALNDGKGTASPITAAAPTDPNGGFPPAWQNPKLYNVVRVKPLHTSTQNTNNQYQQALGAAAPGSPLQFYQLVMTQWPLQLNPPNPIPATQTGLPTNTFPGLTTQTTSFANTALETWEQGNVFTGCMACHNTTKVGTDFLWTLEINAFDDTPQPIATANARFTAPAGKTARAPRSDAERHLLDLLKSTATNKPQ
jgi:hypothetical protein